MYIFICVYIYICVNIYIYIYYIYIIYTFFLRLYIKYRCTNDTGKTFMGAHGSIHLKSVFPKFGPQKIVWWYMSI